MNAHEKILGCNADANYPDADPVATQFEYILCWYWCWFMYQVYVIALYDKPEQKWLLIRCYKQPYASHAYNYTIIYAFSLYPSTRFYSALLCHYIKANRLRIIKNIYYICQCE